MEKKFKLNASQIKRLTPKIGYCFATDEITVLGEKVGYMYREKPSDANDSGWRFFSGKEASIYVDNPDNTHIFDTNTIANYDQDIIPFLNSPFNSAFIRDPLTKKFVKEKLKIGYQ